MFKTFFKDIGAGGPEFAQKYLLPLITFFFIWGIVSSTILLTLNKADLTPRTGIVSKVKIDKVSTGRGNTRYPLTIQLMGETQEFRLVDSYEETFTSIFEKVEEGKEVTIFIVNNWKSKIIWGRGNDIYGIKAADFTIFSLADISSEAVYILLLCILASIIAIVWYVIYRIRRL